MVIWAVEREGRVRVERLGRGIPSYDEIEVMS